MSKPPMLLTIYIRGSNGEPCILRNEQNEIVAYDLSEIEPQAETKVQTGENEGQVYERVQQLVQYIAEENAEAGTGPDVSRWGTNAHFVITQMESVNRLAREAMQELNLEPTVTQIFRAEIPKGYAQSRFPSRRAMRIIRENTGPKSGPKPGAGSLDPAQMLQARIPGVH